MEQTKKKNWRLAIILLLSAGTVLTSFSALAGLTRCPFIILKALTTFLILLIALVAAAGEDRRYKWSIVVGLCFSLGGDVLLSLGEKYFLAGLVSFLGAHISYLIAFTSQSAFAAKKLPFTGWAVYGVIMTTVLWNTIPNIMKIPVMIYMLVILTMAAQSHSRYLASRSAATYLACFGATLFVLSDSLLAFNHFHTHIDSLSVFSLATYYAAQWCIAISIPLQYLKNKIPPKNA
jgi:uncharacterized membrane protein YhhN